MSCLKSFTFTPKFTTKLSLPKRACRGESAVSKADWIQVSAVRDTAALAVDLSKTGLGAGETSAVQLPRELGVELVLMDEWRGRRLRRGKLKAGPSQSTSVG
jgi:predicted nucleic acid-binding protein